VSLADLVRVPQRRPRLGDPAPAAQPRAVFEQQAGPVERPAHQVRLERAAELPLGGLLPGQQRGRVEQRDPRPRGHAVARGRPERGQELARLVPAAGPHGRFGQVAEGPGALHGLVGRIGAVEHPAELIERFAVAPGADRREAADELDAAQRRPDPGGEHHGLGVPGQPFGERAVASHACDHRLPDHRGGLLQRLARRAVEEPGFVSAAGEHDRVPGLLRQQPRQGREPAFAGGSRGDIHGNRLRYRFAATGPGANRVGQQPERELDITGLDHLDGEIGQRAHPDHPVDLRPWGGRPRAVCVGRSCLHELGISVQVYRSFFLPIALTTV
jgi:hypothetical protein